jgi:hypothetical protein
MKIFAYIFSVYLALLTVIPCCVFDDCPDDKAETEQSANHENGDEDCGTCSPFFSCEGCASASVNTSILSFTLAPFTVTKTYTEFLLPFMPDVHYDFWQPPKIG